MRSEQLRGQPALPPRFSDGWINNDVATTASAFPSEPARGSPASRRGVARRNTRGRMAGSDRSPLLQIEQRIHMCGNSHGLRRKLFARGRRCRIGHSRHRTCPVRHDDPRVLERVDRCVKKISKRAATGASQCIGGVVRPAVCILNRLVLRLVDILERVTEGLGLADIGVGELLGDRTDFRKIFQLQRNVRRDAISNDSLLRLPLIDGLNGKKSNGSGFGIDPIGAKHIPHLLHVLRRALEGGLRRVILHGYVELNLRRVRGSLELAIGAHINGVRLRADRGVILGQSCGRAQKKKEKKSEKKTCGFHGSSPEGFSHAEGYSHMRPLSGGTLASLDLARSAKDAPLLRKLYGRTALTPIEMELPGCDPGESREQSLFRGSGRVPIQRPTPLLPRPRNPPRPRPRAYRPTVPLPPPLCQLPQR